MNIDQFNEAERIAGVVKHVMATHDGDNSYNGYDYWNAQGEKGETLATLTPEDAEALTCAALVRWLRGSGARLDIKHGNKIQVIARINHGSHWKTHKATAPTELEALLDCAKKVQQ